MRRTEMMGKEKPSAGKVDSSHCFSSHFISSHLSLEQLYTRNIGIFLLYYNCDEGAHIVPLAPDLHGDVSIQVQSEYSVIIVCESSEMNYQLFKSYG